jgi:hypothetical protein
VSVQPGEVAIAARLARHVRANLVAYSALFVALGGTGVAASTILVPPNSVGSRQVVDHSLQSRDFRAGALKVSEGTPGPRGPQGRPDRPARSRAWRRAAT